MQQQQTDRDVSIVIALDLGNDDAQQHEANAYVGSYVLAIGRNIAESALFDAGGVIRDANGNRIGEWSVDVSPSK
tara:strand:+ start:118 stop:342 length:225 start_codon:yes stop_codon:yes gene_type:complete